LTAPARRHDAAAPVADFRGRRAHGLWQDATKIRREWLDHGLSTQPADRETAEHSLTAIYARISRPQPRFTWVDSPLQAIPFIAGWPTLDQLYSWVRDTRPRGTPPLASDLAMVSSQLRGALSAGLAHADPELSPARKGKRNEPWPELPPWQALTGDRPVPVCWYGQHDASWVAYYDVLHRLGLASYRPDDLDHLGRWTALARSCGWWWPGEDVCVVVDRPELVRTEPVPRAWHEEVRLQRDGVRYRDGWRPLLT
jgi:hypothetical protein